MVWPPERNEWPVCRVLSFFVISALTIGGCCWTFAVWCCDLPAEWTTCNLLTRAATPERFAVPVVFGDILTSA